MAEFLRRADAVVLASLHSAYAQDGYVSQYTTATKAWELTLPALREELSALARRFDGALTWQLLLEYPLYRLRRRIDAVVLSPSAVFAIEIKTGAEEFQSGDKRQAVEYAQDLRDFHAASHQGRLHPILWALHATNPPMAPTEGAPDQGVQGLSMVGQAGLALALHELTSVHAFSSVTESEDAGAAWDNSAYRPVPSVIDAAVSLFAGHGVRDIALASAKNLTEAADAVFSIIAAARRDSQHAVVFLTGVPGAGKTLAGLNIVHDAVSQGLSADGDIVYLSGNTPLVVVLREALARDKLEASKRAGVRTTLEKTRATTRATIQHVNDFLKEYVRAGASAPSGHVIVFDEAQRAWDAKQGKEKFQREESEPFLVLDTMSRHEGWSVTVCLIGIGQEINDGEEGIGGWAEAIRKLSETEPSRWAIYAPEAAFGQAPSPATLGPPPNGVRGKADASLNLDVPMRAYRSPELGRWIEAVLAGQPDIARAICDAMDYPIHLTRQLDQARKWLSARTKGERRKGLLASSGARRLRADGIGELLSATDGASIAHWYLQPPGDVRSSHALEVPANEYTSQGLEVDFAGLCWGGDLLVDQQGNWQSRRLAGNQWQSLRDAKAALYVKNSYRVLLSRAREGMVIWVPYGSSEDHTRPHAEFDAVADYLLRCGCIAASDS